MSSRPNSRDARISIDAADLARRLGTQHRRPASHVIEAALRVAEQHPVELTAALDTLPAWVPPGKGRRFKKNVVPLDHRPTGG